MLDYLMRNDKLDLNVRDLVSACCVVLLQLASCWSVHVVMGLGFKSMVGTGWYVHAWVLMPAARPQCHVS